MTRRPRVELAATLATAALAIAWIARLVPQALAARLQSDECFHATAARWIAAHAALPERLDGFYGGFLDYYPPLFHLLGALAFRLAGLHGFLLVNVAVVAALVLIVAIGVARLAGGAAARWAVCLCLANEFLAAHAVRLYVEALSALLLAALTLALVHLARRPSVRMGAIAGVLAGLAITAKLSALALPPVLLLAALACGWRKRSVLARALAVAAVVAVLVAMPMFVRNWVLCGSPIYPALGRDVDPWLMRLNVRQFTPAPLELYRGLLERAGPALLACTIAGAWLAWRRRRAGAEGVMLAVAVGLVLATPLQPLADVRHLLPLLAAACVLAPILLARALLDQPRARLAAELLALLAAAIAVVAMPRLRVKEDLDESPAMLAAFAAIAQHVPAGETVLARETYDASWYGGRPANWPVPFGQCRHPVAMFTTANPDSFAAAMHAQDLRWLLFTDEGRPGPFDGADWPASVASALGSLEARGRASEVWTSDEATLWRLER
jgi:hypothetical protein